MRNHFIVFIIIFLVLSIFTRTSLYAYSASKHHKFMGEMASEESILDEYLKNNLGFSGGINTVLTNPDEPIGEQTKTIKEWMGYGGIAEDKGFVFPLPRVARHFYDPVSNQGLNDHSPPVISSLEWGREQADNAYSWAKARENYYLALTSETKEEREKYWALTFRSLGQVLHLVQDLASPAHVRNDNHLSLFNFDNDPYEDLWGTSPEGISSIHGALGNPGYQYPVVELDQFDDYWDTGDGRGLAEFTNSNFVSKDTNVDVLSGRHHYDNPQPTGLHREPFEFTDSNNARRTVNVTYYTSNVVDSYAPGRSLNPFNYLTAVSPWDFYTRRYDPDRIHYTLNRKCHEEYAKLLVPRTVGYGAGLLNYFFRGELEVDVEAADDGRIRFIVRNNANEDLNGGSLSLYRITDLEEYELLDIEELVTIPSGMSYELVLIVGRPRPKGYLLVYSGGTFGSEILVDNQAVAAKIVWTYPIYADCWVLSHPLFSSRNLQYQSSPFGPVYLLEIDIRIDEEYGQIEERSFVKININRIHENIRRAKLFYGGYGYVNLDIYNTSTDWEETDPTWISQPITYSYLSSSNPPGETGYASWDVTDYVKNMKTIGEEYIAFRISANDIGFAEFGAREQEFGFYVPFLFIEYGSD